MIRAFILTLTLACGLPCLAESGQHFLHTLGSLALNDAHCQLTVTATKSPKKKQSLLVSWHAGDATTSDRKTLVGDGWFVFIEDVSRVWVFDGHRLSFLHYTDKGLTDSSLSGLAKTWPKAVRDALPESYATKHVP